ncbi:MAG TPA: diacylglycerol kinase family lipid kinase [Dehalococcoidia bacterium]|jgi:diacylglycerol kinase (ATP)|nr:diacylglycerol kinase family lipid kinase [Dehalococcoidia bacterium]
MLALHAKVIVNPVAGAYSTRRKWPRISKLLRHVGLSFDYEYTEGVGHAIELARAAASDGYRYVVAVGGDGTVNEVANGILYSTGSSNTSLGVVSTGTGSDFARSVGIPRDYNSACSFLTSSQRLLIDVGVVEYKSKGQALQRFFINAAGVGFDAAVVETTERLPKYFGGTIPYVAGLLRTLFGYENKSVVVHLGNKVEDKRVLSIVVANGCYFGGGMYMAPQAELNDSLLDVMTVGDIGKFELLKALPTVYKGTHINHPKVRMEKATHITIESSERVLVHADGELLGEGPASFWLMPAALSIVV